MAKGRIRPSTEINAGSMADIAFLLLIFFLVTTTINVDKGILHKLPPPVEDEQEIVEFEDRNVLQILVNARDQLLVEGEITDIKDLREITKKFLTNYGKDPDLSVSPKKAVVSLKNDRGTTYARYIDVQNELKAAYREVRDEYALKKFGHTYQELLDLSQDKKLSKAERAKYDKQAKEVREEFPMRISEAEPESIGG